MKLVSKNGLSADAVQQLVAGRVAFVAANNPNTYTGGFLLPFLLSNVNEDAAALVYTGLQSTTAGAMRHVIGVFQDIPGESATSSQSIAALVNDSTTAVAANQKAINSAFDKVTRTQQISIRPGSVRLADGETEQDYINRTIVALIASAESKLATEVANYIAASGLYVGSNVPRANVQRTGFVDVPMFKTDGSYNPTGLAMLQSDFAAMGFMESDVYYFGGSAISAYAIGRQMATMNAGFDPSKTDVFQANRIFHDSSVENAFTQQNKPNAMLAIRKGALKFVQAVMYSQPTQTSAGVFYSVQSPVTGLIFDIAEVRRMTTNGVEVVLQASCTWTILGYGQCSDSLGKGARRNVKDVFAYNLVAENTTLLDLPKVTIGQTIAHANRDMDLAIDVCANPAQVLLQGQTVGSNFYVTSIATADGATPTAYSWSVDGTPNAATTPFLTLPTAGLSAGDLIEVTVTFTAADGTTSNVTASKTYN